LAESSVPTAVSRIYLPELNGARVEELAAGAHADATGERIFLTDSLSISDRGDGGHVAVKHERDGV
jgi:hypothetical protein